MEINLLILVIINLVIFKISKNFFKIAGIFDYPSEKRKIHKNPISLAGGLIVLISYIISIVLLTDKVSFFKDFLIILFSILFYLIGYFDDKFNIKPLKKTFLNIILIIIFLFTLDEYILTDLKSIYLQKNFFLENYGILITIFCYVTFLNALNMYDGINGQSGIYILFLKIYLFYFTQNELFLLLTIPLLFFIYMNFQNKCFLGNSGVNFISFLILISFIDSYKLNYFKSVEEIIVLMILPGIEMVRLFFFRILKSKSPFLADNNHLHHLLLIHLEAKKVVIITSSYAILPIILYHYFKFSYSVILIFFVLYFILIFLLSKKNLIKN